ncbi:MAG: zinc dependent phospholipase C family protein [Proteobacteria bacterium]|nr:zinc dependent phospholipase C family protein [Pseudomonadota bacterium]
MIFIISLLVLLLPETAFAFGPAFHLKIGYELLNYLTLFSPLTQQLLSEYPLDFLYGNISPDIIIGKRFLPYHKHCHNWNIAKDLIDFASSPSQKAFAYGYLTHLASDVIAHNYFVPLQTISTFKSRTLTHLYWETRLDNKVDREIWYFTEKFKSRDFSKNEYLMERVLSYNLFPFVVSKKIYKGYVLFSSLEQWHKAINMIRNFSKYRIEPEFLEDIKKLSLEFSLKVLLRKDDSHIYSNDPMGKKSIAIAQMIRKNLKQKFKNNNLNIDDEITLYNHFKNKFRKALFNPKDLMAIISEE